MRTITEFGLVALLAAFPLGANAGSHSSKKNNEQTWTGTLTTVSANRQTLTGGHWWDRETFNLGRHCDISTLEKTKADLGDLRPGEEVRIRYQDAGGVWVADRVVEVPLHYSGTVYAVNPKAGTVTMTEAALVRPFVSRKQFHVADNCKVTFPNGRNVTVASLQPGDRITITYELPGGSLVAYAIRNKSSACVATVEAIQVPDRTLEAKGRSGEKKFHVGDDCQIMLGKEKEKGHLKDLVAGQKYKFIYQSVNGVNILDRITPAQGTSPSETASTM